MLVLMRRTGEEIAIPSLGVSIKIVSTHGNRTRIGIDAPRDLEIRRAELTAESATNAASLLTVPLCCERV
jgi:carbon storage regulator CsrA